MSTTNQAPDPMLSVEQWLALRKDECAKIDPATAETTWVFAEVLDPYGVHPDIELEFSCVGREYFARAPGSDIWVWFGDLPEDTRKALWDRDKRELGFPAGLKFR